jgi:hypothetical protein
MALAGLLTVFLAFVAMVLVGILATVGPMIVSGEESLGAALPVALFGGLMVLFFGTLFTLGLPYLVGALVAMLFADP